MQKTLCICCVLSINRYLVRTYACMYAFLFAYMGFLCSILYESSQYSISIYNNLVNRQFYEYICFTLIRKKENVKLGSYMWGLNFTMSCSIKISLNKFKVEISSLPRRLGPSVYTHTGQCKRTGGCYNTLVVAFFSTGGGVKGKKIYTC